MRRFRRAGWAALLLLGIFLTAVPLVLAGSPSSPSSPHHLTAYAAPPGPQAPLATNTPTPSGTPLVKLYMVYGYGLAAGQTDEAVRLINLGGSSANFAGWQVTNPSGSVTLPGGATLAAGQKIWIANQATGFRTYFGFNPDYEYGADTDPTVPNATATAGFAFSDSGTGVQLKDNTANTVDAVVYEGGSTSTTGWSGVAVQLYNFNIPNAGQIVYRKLDETTGLPVPDTNTSNDWAEDPNNSTPCDNIDCFKVLKPGWALTDPAYEDMFYTKRFTETNVTSKFLVAPDNTFDAIHGLIMSATTSISVEGYDWQAQPLVNDILAAHSRGVTVTIALDGNPTGGLDNDTLWAAQQWTNAGIPVYFFAGQPGASTDEYRYNNMHQKFMIVDDTWLATGSENFALFGMPSDNKANGTKGNRGSFVITNAPDVVAYARRLYGFDVAPGKYADLVLYPNPALPTPPAGYTPTPEPDFTAYTVQKPTPLVVTETENIEIVQSPDNELRNQDSLVGLVNTAGTGDEVLVEQQYERKYWRTSPIAGPNPRLEAYIRAGQRGASVRILLDAANDDCGATNNSATVSYVQSFGLSNLQARIGTPTSDNIHNKLVMVNHAGTKTVHMSSINGSENASKNNREFGLQITSSAAYQYYKDVFDFDWGRGFVSNCFPATTSTPTQTVTGGFTATSTRTPTVTPTSTATPIGGGNHLVISQVYGGGGNSGATYRSDFVEIFNPSASPVSVNGWSIQYASSTGAFTAGNLTSLAGTVQPYSYFLVKEADGANVTTTLALPTPDVTDNITMSANAGKVALVSSTTVLPCGQAGVRCWPTQTTASLI
ncbi:MAG: phospholipase D-like domain-containing protein, partial [Chloroflexia bacterium]